MIPLCQEENITGQGEKGCLIEKVDSRLSLLSQLWEVNKKDLKIVNQEVVIIMLFRYMKVSFWDGNSSC